MVGHAGAGPGGEIGSDRGRRGGSGGTTARGGIVVVACLSMGQPEVFIESNLKI